MTDNLPTVSKPETPQDKVQTLLEVGASLPAIWREVKDAMTHEQFLAAIESAQKYFKKQANINPAAERGKAIERLHNIYLRSLQIQDYKICLAAQKELNRLLQLTKIEADAAGMVSMAEVQATWDSVMGALQEAIMQVPTQQANSLAKTDDAKRIKRLLLAALRKAFAEALEAFNQ